VAPRSPVPVSPPVPVRGGGGGGGACETLPPPLVALAPLPAPLPAALPAALPAEVPRKGALLGGFVMEEMDDKIKSILLLFT
jgi:hypothetical protein